MLTFKSYVTLDIDITMRKCPPTPQLAYDISYARILQCHYLSVSIRDRIMHPNTSVSLVNEHC